MSTWILHGRAAPGRGIPGSAGSGRPLTPRATAAQHPDTMTNAGAKALRRAPGIFLDEGP